MVQFPDSSEGYIRPEIKALVERGNVTLDEWKSIRGNSWELEALVPVLDDEAFANHFDHCLNNTMQSKRRPSISYEICVEDIHRHTSKRRYRRAQQARQAPGVGRRWATQRADCGVHRGADLYESRTICLWHILRCTVVRRTPVRGEHILH